MRLKRYAIKEIFLTLQGEGHYAGRAAVFCRFTGCNLWSGKEYTRETSSCTFCDTDFVGTDGTHGGRYTAEDLVVQILSMWKGNGKPMVIFTGGEPLLQLDEQLVQHCQDHGLFVAVETNGTRPAPSNIDWLCISPKPRSTIVLKTASELKLVFPQPESSMHPSQFEDFDAEHFFLQPMYGDNVVEHRQQVVDYCIENPKWRLSIQMQKVLQVR